MNDLNPMPMGMASAAAPQQQPPAPSIDTLTNQTALPIDDTLVTDSFTSQVLQSEGRKDGSLPLATFERYVFDLRYQPPWRVMADTCADYYDGNQLSADDRAKAESEGRAAIVSNIIRPTIDVVLGMEAKTRQDWRAVSDSGEFQDVAEARSYMLKEAERETGADRACSDAYAGQIKAGLHWVEVSRNSDPFGYPYRVKAVHRREIWWDWRSKEPDLSDARYLIRKRWVDIDEAIAHFPDSEEVLEAAMNGWMVFDRAALNFENVSTALVDAHGAEMRSTIDSLEWRNTERRQICLTEVWYRTWHRGHVIKVGGKVVPVDTKNPVMAAAIVSGKVKVIPGVYTKLRLSFWAGPHRLSDTPMPGRRFPYVPFWGFREDRTGVPYGLIRPMIDPQDEYNARRSKLMWLLQSKRVLVDSDAVDTQYNTIAEVAAEVNRPDAVVVMNPNRRPTSTIRIDSDLGLANQQFEVMKDAQTLVQSTAGVYQSMLGDAGNASSGYAINSLVEQGATTLAEINDNFRFGRRIVGELLDELIVADIGTDRYTVVVGDGDDARTIVLNDVQPDGTVLNDLVRAKTKIALNDIPSTPSYKAQQLMMLTELTKSMPPDIQAVLIDMVIEATDLPERRKAAQRVRTMLNIKDPNKMTPEEQQAAQQQIQAQQQAEQQAQQLAQEKIAAGIEHDKAAAADRAAAAQEKTVRTQQLLNDQNNSGKLADQMEALSEHVGQLTKMVGDMAGLTPQQDNGQPYY